MNSCGRLGWLSITLTALAAEIFSSWYLHCAIVAVLTAVHTVAACSQLRSANHGDIVIPRARSTRFGCHSFHVCGPTIWHKLPQDLRRTDTREKF